jgi:hypothetical protein
MVAIAELLELHTTEPVKSSVAPEEVVPIAMYWAVCPGAATDWVPGMMESDTTLPPTWPPPVEVTTRVALAVTGPLNAEAEAMIVVVPAPTAVATPEESTVATAGVLEVQVTPVVNVCDDLWLALP